MGIRYFENEKIFKLDTQNSSYIIGVIDTEGFLAHLYYGKCLKDHDLRHLFQVNEEPLGRYAALPEEHPPSTHNRDRIGFYNTLPLEYPPHGMGDYRESCIRIQTLEGHSVVGVTYHSHNIYEGKPKLLGLPAVFGTSADCETLEIISEDKTAGIRLTFLYTVFEEHDVITRSVKAENIGENRVYLDKMLSVCLDMENRNYELITECGGWAREREIQRRTIARGIQGCASARGVTSHQYQPFMAIVSPDANQSQGEVYGMNFVYSGNFTATVELDEFNMIRAFMGINAEEFKWQLEPMEVFQAPEVVLTYSSEGIAKMTHNYHDLYRNHLIRGEYKDKNRPILINNWEATYFDFDNERLIGIAKEAKSLGIEMLVVDDGWFGHRNDDSTSLGDWTVNEEKLSGGLSYLSEELHNMGMKLGIWMEPEMISPDSSLYREHSDWAIAVPGRSGSLSRNQYVLDMTRPEVRDGVYQMIYDVLSNARIDYVKWDMNRQLSDLGSLGLSSERMGELCHRYVLGVYELQERLLHDFPYLLLENCSGGGGRFDPGMLYYSPHIWCSDETDAIERLWIQEGTSMIYPLSTQGCHVSDCPNHMTFRNIPFKTRGYAALGGAFGYELDVTKITNEDKEEIKEQVTLYHKYQELMRKGDYYRIESYRENHYWDCWEVVAKDKKEAVVTFIQVRIQANVRSKRIYIPGLDEKQYYQIEGYQGIYSGVALAEAGFRIKKLPGDFQGLLLHITAV